MSREIRSLTEDRNARADRWTREAQLGIAAVEPEWWLRMECGWLALGRPGPNPTGANWSSWLQRRNLPFKPAWRHLV